MLATNEQQLRIRDKILAKLIKKYGEPSYIDEEMIADITTRAAKLVAGNGSTTH